MVVTPVPNVPEVNLVSLSHLYSRYSRAYTFEILPHVSFGNNESELVQVLVRTVDRRLRRAG